jgi:mono/diheme cytochrome c family protein
MLTVGLVVSTGTAVALPFNQDMVGNQISTGDMQRPEPARSIPRGAAKRFVGMKREDALTLVNPVKPTTRSIAHGKRLFQANCTPCHGKIVNQTYVLGPLATQLPGAPLFQGSFMWDKPDAHYFQFIHFGGMAIMPKYGYKFSIKEHWDIVNYIRDVQRQFKEGTLK